MDRVILHCDCNSYFASVESIDRPELKQVPMAVCGDPEKRHGIILARNELAKKFGVHTPEPIWQALRKCPELVLITPHHHKYEEYCKKINQIYEQYTDQVEPCSIDESYLDVTGSQHLFGDGKTIADTLRKRIREEIGLSISVGVSFNKTFAKLGSDYKKPDATTVISKENFQEILWPLAAGDMLMVGQSAAKLLSRYGIHTIGDIAKSDKKQLTAMLGKSGNMLWDCANGLDLSPVKHVGERDPVKSISNNITFSRDLIGQKDIHNGLLLICDQVGTRLRRQKLYCGVVHIQIKDPNLKIINRQRKLRSPTNITADILFCAQTLLNENWSSAAPIRMLSVGVSDLSLDCGMQMDFFEDTEKKRRAQKLDATLDNIRSRFGKDALVYGSVLDSDLKR